VVIFEIEGNNSQTGQICPFDPFEKKGSSARWETSPIIVKFRFGRFKYRFPFGCHQIQIKFPINENELLPLSHPHQYLSSDQGSQ
jgi:hypothetical protein